MKGIFNKRPSLPRYTVTWNPEIVLKLFSSWGENKILNLKKLTQKLCTLLMLVSGRRGQTIILINIKNIKVEEHEVRISIGDIVKTSNKNFQEPEIVLKKFHTKKLCIVSTLQEYLRRTEKLRGGEDQLLISYGPPHKKIGRDTLSRYVKTILTQAGIDTKRFKPHSLRSAATSLAARTNVSIATIMASIGWKRESTFAIYYNKRLETNTGELGKAVVSLKN